MLELGNKISFVLKYKAEFFNYMSFYLLVFWMACAEQAAAPWTLCTTRLCGFRAAHKVQLG